MREIVIDSTNQGGRIDKYLLRYMQDSSKGFIYKMLRKKNITLNGGRANGSEILEKGDKITLYLSDETIAKFQKTHIGVYKTVTVCYEDEHLLILNKPSGLLSQTAEGSTDSLICRVRAYLGDGYSPALINRLDRNTSGLVICGKNLSSIRNLHKAQINNEITKKYLAVVIGTVDKPGILQNEYEKNRETNTASIIKTFAPHNETLRDNTKFSNHHSIVTEYEPIKTFSSSETKKESTLLTLLELTLHTGKSHQIRLHMQSIGHPVLGDAKYGGGKPPMYLHAHKLFFNTSDELAYMNGKTFEVASEKINKLLGD